MRRGFAYIAQRADGAYLLERRPNKGLLGGMLGWPGSDWSETPTEQPPVEADWTTLTAEARHAFTHFHLRLVVKTAIVPLDRPVRRGHFLDANTFQPSTLPTVMRKAYDLTKFQ